MAERRKLPMEFGDDGLKFIDDILSREETEDVLSMMTQADESVDSLRLPSFYTSSQTGGRNPSRRPMTPPLSPLLPPTPEGVFAENEVCNNATMPVINNKVNTDLNLDERANNLLNIDTELIGKIANGVGDNVPGDMTLEPGTKVESKNNMSASRVDATGHDPEKLETERNIVAGEVAMGNNVTTVTTGSVMLSDDEEDDRSTKSTGGSVADDVHVAGDGDGTDTGIKPDPWADSPKETYYHSSRIDELFEKMGVVEDILSMMNERSTKLGGMVKDLTASRVFST